MKTTTTQKKRQRAEDSTTGTISRKKELLAQIEATYGVDKEIVLAIWGRETDFGRHKLARDAVRVLASHCGRT